MSSNKVRVAVRVRPFSKRGKLCWHLGLFTETTKNKSPWRINSISETNAILTHAILVKNWDLADPAFFRKLLFVALIKISVLNFRFLCSCIRGVRQGTSGCVSGQPPAINLCDLAARRTTNLWATLDRTEWRYPQVIYMQMKRPEKTLCHRTVCRDTGCRRWMLQRIGRGYGRRWS